MAESKKEVPKKETSKKATTTKTAAKVVKKPAVKKVVKNSVKKPVKKATKKVDDKKVETKKVNAKKPKVEKKVKKSSTKNKNYWKLIAVVLLIVALLLSFSIGVKILGTSGAENSSETDEVSQEEVNLNSIELIVVEDPNCENCQVDTFINQIKTYLIPESDNINKVSFESDIGQNIVQSLGIKVVPIFLFSKNLDQKDNWENLKPIFFPVKILDGQEYYLMNPMYVQMKVLVEEPIILDSAVVIGDENAPVTIVEFADFSSPEVAVVKGNVELLEEFRTKYPDYESPTAKIIEEYVETGKVKFVHYNIPNDNSYPDSRTAHNAALCANEQDAWTAYSNVLFEKRTQWIGSNNTEDTLKGFAVDIGLDKYQFNACLNANRYNDQINNEIKLIIPYGVAIAPTYFINREVLGGVADYNIFKTVIDNQLAIN